MSTFDKFSLKGKVAIVTGATRGLGQGIAIGLAEAGADIVCVGRSDDSETREKIEALGRQYLNIRMSVSEENAPEEIVKQTVERFGKLDILVNAAGIPGPSARVEDYSFSDAKKVLSVNLFGTFLMMHTVLPVMQAQKHGAILNFGSVSGVVGYPFESAYGASKAAIIHLTKNAASENGGNGVRINAISPGWVKTNMMATILDSYKNVGFDNADENVTLGPMGRPGTPEEIANVAAFICSEEASYANGSNFLVDGGMTLG